MQWSSERQIEVLLRLPWTIVPESGDEDGDLVLTIEEVPAAIGVGRSEAEVEADLFASLECALRAYLASGERPPLPARVRTPLPWEPGAVATVARRLRYVLQNENAEAHVDPSPIAPQSFELDTPPLSWEAAAV